MSAQHQQDGEQALHDTVQEVYRGQLAQCERLARGLGTAGVLHDAVYAGALQVCLWEAIYHAVAHGWRPAC